MIFRDFMISILGDWRGPVVSAMSRRDRITLLRGADLEGAYLFGVDFRRATLGHTNLRSTDLHEADLRDAILSGADLSGACLRNAKIDSARLYGTILEGADLFGVDLFGVDLIIDLGQELRGYRRLLYKSLAGPRFMAGCHYFTLDEAREHWGPAYDNRHRGDEYLMVIDLAEKLARHRGWI